MTRYLFTLLLSSLLLNLGACNNVDESKTESPEATRAKINAALFRKNSCVSCHKMEGKQVGPGFKEIAEKYKDDVTAEDKLIAKITMGGEGVWGTMPMPPMSKVQPDELKIMVTYILSLAK